MQAPWAAVRLIEHKGEPKTRQVGKIGRPLPNGDCSPKNSDDGNYGLPGFQGGDLLEPVRQLAKRAIEYLAKIDENRLQYDRRQILVK